MQSREKSIVVICALFVLGTISAVQAAKKSVYAITRHSNSTICAFKVINNELEYQTETYLDFGSGAVGLAIDPDSWTIFTSYDGSNNIGIINARTMEPEENPVAQAPWELAGIVWDNAADRLYGLRRGYNDIVIYEWDPIEKELIQYGDEIDLPVMSSGGLGIALDEQSGLLYVTNNTNTVYVFDVNDWSYSDSFDVKVGTNDRKCVAIAVYNDGDGNSWVYTGGYSHTDLPLPDHTYLVKTSTESPYSGSEVDVGQRVSGVTCDPETGLVYITSFHQDIRVYNSNLVLQYSDGDNVDDNPADICLVPGVAYKDPNFILVKDNNDPNDDSVWPFDPCENNYLDFDIYWDANGNADTNVVLIDYLPVEVNYYSSTPTGDYNSTDHTVTWVLGDVSSDDSNSFFLRTKVNSWVRPGEIITNYCEIESDNYLSTAFEDTNVAYWQDLIGYWKLDETEGIIAEDSAGNNDGMLHNFPTDDSQWVDGQIGGALDFKSEDYAYVSIAPIGALEGNTVTISAWIYADTLSGWRPIFTQYEYDSGYNGYYLYINGGRPGFYIGGPYQQEAISPTSIDVDRWYHIVGTNDGENLKIYVDGIPMDTKDSTGLTGVRHTAYIGREDVSARYFDGIIDDVWVYNWAMSEDELSNNADFNNDWVVNLIDYAILAASWESQSGQGRYNDDCDLQDNDVIDYNDLALFCDNWLWGPGWTQEAMMMGCGMGMQQAVYSEPVSEMTEEQTAEAQQWDEEELDMEPDFEAMIEFLDKVWFSGELKECMTGEEYLEFRKILESHLE